MKRILFLLVFCTFFGCTQNEETNQSSSKASESSETTKENGASGTAQMVKLLRDVNARIDPMKVSYHLNSSRAEQYKLKVNSAQNDNELLMSKSQYAYELLLAGKTHESIMEIEQLLEMLAKLNADKAVINNLKQLQGLAYTRLGEQDNCVGKNNPESCIIPIKGAGVYNLKKGSETAIRIYEEMLVDRPDDEETIWLLNIAYMTIGKYPEGVPAKFRIPEKEFKSDYKIPAFKNIGNKTIIGTSGLAGGSCVEDFNNDGLLDIVASSWGGNDQIKIFFNLGNGDFSDQTDASGLKGITGGLNLNHADYNNDGFEDILVLRGAWFFEQGQIPNSLLKNNGDGTFSDVTIESGLFSQYPTQAATWCDVNLDGWLDLFIGNETSSRYSCPSELFINNKGHFENRTVEAGLTEAVGMIKGVCSGDVNNDGWPDIYISSLGRPNILLKNNGDPSANGTVSFTNISTSANVAKPIQSFPTWMWDYNNDGLLDIFVAPFSTGKLKSSSLMVSNARGKHVDDTQLCIYNNNGDGTFTERGTEMGLTEPVFAMGSNYGDIDNDGSLDFYIGSGEPSFSSLVPNKLYRNNEGKSFQDVTYSGRVGHIQKGHGVSFGDFDNDGDQDIFHVLGGAYEGDIFGDALFENPGGTKNNWTTLLLKGNGANKSAIGARVKLVCTNKDGSEKTFYHVVSTGGSFGSNSLQLEIGLGKAAKIKTIEIQWPMNPIETEVYQDIEVNRFIRIEQGAPEVIYEERKQFSF